MYMTRVDSGSFTEVGVWKTDGTLANISKILVGYGTGPVHVFNDTVFFVNFESATGFELWYLDPNAPTAIDEREYGAPHAMVYPNPSTGIFSIKSDTEVQYEVYNAMGKKVRSRQKGQRIDLSLEPKGLYFVNIFDTEGTWTEKIILR